MNISRNKITGKIERGILGKAFRSGDWESCLDDKGIVLAKFVSAVEKQDLEDAIKDKKVKIESNRKISIHLPMEYGGSTFITSEIAVNNLRAAFVFLEEPIAWLDIDGNSVILSVTQVGELVVAMMNKRSQVYLREAELRTGIDACVSTKEVEALDITFI